MPAQHLPSEFLESQYQSLIESIFRNDFLRVGDKFEINFYNGIAEKAIGYDIEIKTFVPIFLQIKRSELYLKGSSTKQMQERDSILHYRDFPGAYYFNLHVDNIAKDYLQHNLLYNLCFEGSYARYIAPLFIEKKMLEYLNYNMRSIFWQSPYNNFLTHQSTYFDWNDRFFMEHSISIKPHKIVKKKPREVHKYFYNRKLETSFHSDVEKIENAGTVFIERFISQLNRSVIRLRESKDGNFEYIFLNIINSIKASFNENKDWEKNEIDIINLIIERETLNNEFVFCKSLSDLKPSNENYKILSIYLKERFDTQSILISRRSNPSFNYL